MGVSHDAYYKKIQKDPNFGQNRNKVKKWAKWAKIGRHRLRPSECVESAVDFLQQKGC